MKVKRITSLLITTLIILSVLNNIAASAKSLYDSENHPDYSFEIKTTSDKKYDYFNLENGTLILRKIKDGNKICEMPNVINNEKVMYADLLCFTFEEITSLYIPENFKGFYIYSDNYYFDEVPSANMPFEEAVNVFSECNKLKVIKVDENNENFTSLNNVLYNKIQTELIAYPRNKKEKSFKIPKGVKYITPKAFYKSKLKKISIPKSIKIIGDNSFVSNKNLKSVNLKSTKKAPIIDENAFKKTKKGIKFYVKNKKVAKSLRKQLKGSGVKKAKIYVGKTLVYKNVK